ncbi:MAG: beta-propeller domain-containing protein [Pseudomonadota bacterium]|nr:beta-propeller domain-containing protein [Pseudomonadota bacterium]
MSIRNCCCASVAFVLLASCGGGGSGSSSQPPVVIEPPEPNPTGLWIRSDGDGEGLVSYTAKLTQIGATRSATGGAVLEAAPAADASSGGFSSTYTLEANVDEYDIVKYNGSTLAIAPSRSGCCFIAEPLAAADSLPPPPDQPALPQIELFLTDPTSGAASLQSVIDLDEGVNAEGMYLSETGLQVLLSTAWWGVYGDRFTTPDGWLDEQVSLKSFDVTDPENPSLASELSIEGALVTSRRTGDEIHIISRHAPNIAGLVAYPQTEEEVANNETILAEASDEDVLPEIRIDGELVSPLTFDGCYRVDPEHPLAVPAPGDSTITTMLTVSASSGEILRSACTLEPVTGVYMGDTYVALTHVRWDLEEGGTMVHLLDRDSFDYIGSEKVEGDLYSGGNADFRISESSGALRLVTTQWTGDPEDSFRHRLYVVSPEANAPELELLGALGDDPEARIGKPNEDLYGVRFMGDRAYMVTFERIDPLYVVDLSVLTAPVIVGELEVPGFSDLLHEVSDDLLLGLGSSEGRFPKLELFNVSDISRPTSQGLIELGADLDWGYSPAQYNRYAFTYLAGDTVDRLTVPYAAGGVEDGLCCIHVDRVALFEIRDKASPAEAAIVAVGEVALTPGSVDGDTRVVLDSEALYVISRTDLLGGFWSNPEAVSSMRQE